MTQGRTHVEEPDPKLVPQGGSCAAAPATGLAPPHEHTWAVIPRPYLACACGATMPANGDTLPQPAVDVDALRYALQGFAAVVSESRGVAGWHLNDAEAPWGEFAWVAVLEEAAKAQQPPAPGVVDEVAPRGLALYLASKLRAQVLPLDELPQHLTNWISDHRRAQGAEPPAPAITHRNADYEATPQADRAMAERAADGLISEGWIDPGMLHTGGPGQARSTLADRVAEWIGDHKSEQPHA